MPLHKTAQQGDTNISHFWIDRMKNPTFLGSLEIAQILIESGAYKNAKLPNGLTAAQLASDNGNEIQ